jgi:hypothetical protein
MVFPLTGEICKSASKVKYSDFITSSKPLKTDNTTIKAIVPTKSPTTDIIEITFIRLCDFLEIKYRFAMKKGRCILFLII